MKPFEGSAVQTQWISVNSKPTQIFVRTGNLSSKVFIDQLTFVCSIHDFNHDMLSLSELRQLERYRNQPHDLEQVLDFYYHNIFLLIFKQLSSIFGFQTFHARANGFNGYKRSWQLGTPPQAFRRTIANYAMVAMEGNRDTICVNLSATGLLVAKDGWEKRLHQFALKTKSFKLTRVDLARDFFHGEYNIEAMKKDYESGCYKLSNRQPHCDLHGLDWFNDDTASGRTFYIGSRKNSSRLVRGYEKGKQLGDPDSAWFRVEIEYRSRDLILPIDMLLHPSAYFSEYPALFRVLKQVSKISKPLLKKKIIKINYDQSIKIYSRQVGRFVNFLVEVMQKSSEEVVEILRAYVPRYALPTKLDSRRYFIDY